MTDRVGLLHEKWRKITLNHVKRLLKCPLKREDILIGAIQDHNFLIYFLRMIGVCGVTFIDKLTISINLVKSAD